MGSFGWLADSRPAVGSSNCLTGMPAVSRRSASTFALGTYVTAGLVAEVAPDDVVVATGAVPARLGFQRAMPMVDRLPGIDDPSALAIHDVLAGSDAGRHVLVVDDLGDWRGLGTALSLAESGRAVTIVTSAAVVGGGLVHSAVDGPLRKQFAAAGGAMLPSPSAPPPGTADELGEVGAVTHHASGDVRRGRQPLVLQRAATAMVASTPFVGEQVTDTWAPSGSIGSWASRFLSGISSKLTPIEAFGSTMGWP